MVSDVVWLNCQWKPFTMASPVLSPGSWTHYRRAEGSRDKGSCKQRAAWSFIASLSSHTVSLLVQLRQSQAYPDCRHMPSVEVVRTHCRKACGKRKRMKPCLENNLWHLSGYLLCVSISQSEVCSTEPSRHGCQSKFSRQLDNSRDAVQTVIKLPPGKPGPAIFCALSS